MRNSERVSVYFVGFIIGMVIVSMLLARRASAIKSRIPGMPTTNKRPRPAEPLPAGVEPTLVQGAVLRFGYLPDATSPRSVSGC